MKIGSFSRELPAWVLLMGLFLSPMREAAGSSPPEIIQESVPFAFTKMSVGARNLALGGTSSTLAPVPEGLSVSPDLLPKHTRNSIIPQIEYFIKGNFLFLFGFSIWSLFRARFLNVEERSPDRIT